MASSEKDHSAQIGINKWPFLWESHTSVAGTTYAV